MSVLRRITGMGIAGSLALALLAGGCVLAATVGPREAQATGLLGVQQMMNGLPQVEKTIVVTTNYQSVNSALQGVFQQVSLTPANLDDVTAQLRRDFGGGPLPLAPQSADWAAMTSGPRGVISTLPALQRDPRAGGGRLPVPGRRSHATGGRQHAGHFPRNRHPGRGHRADGQRVGAATRLSGGGHRPLADDDLRERTAEPVFQAEPRRHRDRRAHGSGFLVLEGRSAASGTEPLCEPEQAVGGRVHRGSRRARHDAGDLRPGGPEHPVGASGRHHRAARPGPGAVQRDEAVHAPDSPADRAPGPDVERAEHVVRPARAAGDACRGLEWRERPVVDGLCGPGGGGRRDDASRGPDGRGPPVRGDGRAAGTWSVTGGTCSGAGPSARRWPACQPPRWPGRSPCSSSRALAPQAGSPGGRASRRWQSP